MDSIALEERLQQMEKLLLTNKNVLTFDEACDYTGISRSYMYKLTASGKIPHSKPSGKLIFLNRDRLETWLLANHRGINQ